MSTWREVATEVSTTGRLRVQLVRNEEQPTVYLDIRRQFPMVGAMQPTKSGVRVPVSPTIIGEILGRLQDVGRGRCPAVEVAGLSLRRLGRRIRLKRAGLPPKEDQMAPRLILTTEECPFLGETLVNFKGVCEEHPASEDEEEEQEGSEEMLL